MNEMALPSRHRIKNSNPGALRLSTLPLGHVGSHNINFLRMSGKKHFVSLKLQVLSGVRALHPRISGQADLTTAPEPPPSV